MGVESDSIWFGKSTVNMQQDTFEMHFLFAKGFGTQSQDGRLDTLSKRNT